MKIRYLAGINDLTIKSAILLSFSALLICFQSTPVEAQNKKPREALATGHRAKSSIKRTPASEASVNHEIAKTWMSLEVSRQRAELEYQPNGPINDSLEGAVAAPLPQADRRLLEIDPQTTAEAPEVSDRPRAGYSPTVTAIDPERDALRQHVDRQVAARNERQRLQAYRNEYLLKMKTLGQNPDPMVLEEFRRLQAKLK